MSDQSPNAYLPEKSKKYYEKVYSTFITWKKDNNATSTSEPVLLAYFNKLAVSNKPSSLWTYYSLLRSTISLYEGINIENYGKLLTFLKHKSKGFQPKRACVFTSDEINAFLNTAPDGEYLPTKVALIMGIMGACRTTEMYEMKIEDIHIDVHKSAWIVNIPRPTVYKPRKFTIPPKYYDKCQKYLNGRSEGTNVYVFHQYRNNKITKQRIGIGSFRRMARNIAVYLKLDDAEKYSGHSLRRSSERIFVEAGGDPSFLTPWIPAGDLLLNHHGENGHKQRDFASDNSPGCPENEANTSGKFEFVDIFKDMDSSEDEISVKAVEQAEADESSEEGDEEEEDQEMQDEQNAKPALPVEDRAIQMEQSVSQESREVPPLILSNCTNCTFNIIINNYFDGKKV